MESHAHYHAKHVPPFQLNAYLATQIHSLLYYHTIIQILKAAFRLAQQAIILIHQPISVKLVAHYVSSAQ
jgi:hypothetical protein